MATELGPERRPDEGEIVAAGDAGLVEHGPVQHGPLQRERGEVSHIGVLDGHSESAGHAADGHGEAVVGAIALDQVLWAPLATERI